MSNVVVDILDILPRVFIGPSFKDAERKLHPGGGSAQLMRDVRQELLLSFDKVRELCAHAINRRSEMSNFIRSFDLQLDFELSLRNSAGGVFHLRNRVGQTANPWPPDDDKDSRQCDG